MQQHLLQQTQFSQVMSSSLFFVVFLLFEFSREASALLSSHRLEIKILFQHCVLGIVM